MKFAKEPIRIFLSGVFGLFFGYLMFLGSENIYYSGMAAGLSTFSFYTLSIFKDLLEEIRDKI